MNIRAILCTASFAALVSAAKPAVSQEAVEAGMLRCEVASGLGLIIASSKEMSCIFTSSTGHAEKYLGAIRKFGLDIGVTDQGVLMWHVFAPTREPSPWALAGDYAGVTASATIGAGAGANVLIGGSSRTISLQPLSVQTQVGLDLAGGVAEMSLRPAP
jgi:hypothetical protein